MKRLAPLVLLLALAGGMSACGGDDEPTAQDTTNPTATAGEPSTTPSTAPSTTPSASSTTSGPTTSSDPSPSEDEPSEPAPVPSRPPASGDLDLNDAKLPQFNAVNNTITCLFDDFEGVQVRCDVMGAKWPVERPAGCEEAFGDSATLGAAPLLTCHGDTIFSPDVTLVLKAGKSAAFGDLECTASKRTVTCENGDDRAFTVSKADFSLR